MNAPRLIPFSPCIDPRGVLVSFECNHNLPFDLKRAFAVLDVPGDAVRGGHAHKHGHEVLVALSGAVTILAGEEHFFLSGPAYGLYVPPGVKVDLKNFSPDCVLLALCDNYYDPNDNMKGEGNDRHDSND